MYWKIVITLFAAGFAVGIAATGSGGMVGAPIDANTNDQDVKNALQFAVVEHNLRSNDAYLSDVSRVVKVQRQVVSGIKYIFTVEMGKTSCRKGGLETVCPVLADPNQARTYTCKFAVWSQPWINMVKLVKHSCQN